MDINLKVKKAKLEGKSITITVSLEKYKAIEKAAKKNGVSKNKIVNILIDKGVDVVNNSPDANTVDMFDDNLNEDGVKESVSNSVSNSVKDSVKKTIEKGN